MRFGVKVLIFSMYRSSRAFSAINNNYSNLYSQVTTKLKEINYLQGIVGLLTWDEMTYMPPGAAQCRGTQNSVMAGIIYDKSTDKELGEMLQMLKVAPQEQLNEVQRALIRDEHLKYTKNTALPKELVQKLAQLETDSYNAWVEARKTAEFGKFAPFLQEWVVASLQKARYINPNEKPYDVLLQDFEKGMTSDRLDEIFLEIRNGLVQLIADIRASRTLPDTAWMRGGSFDTELQSQLCKGISIDLGFDESNGRLDASVHPFTGGAHPTDVRMTTRFKANDITEGLTGCIHETGHALYEQGRNLSPDWKDLSVSGPLSMGIHESQSLLWERMVGLSKPFQRYLLPKLQAIFPDKFSDRTPEDLYLAMNCIKDPSIIRLESDEVTYTMHIILRYEIEKGLLDGSIPVEEVPAVWNSKMKEYLGVEVMDDAQGCLQDIHWAGGAFGYFPTYSLGAMYACQLYACAKEQVDVASKSTCTKGPTLEENIALGNFAVLKNWLNKNVHKLGSVPASGDELMERVTGNRLQPETFLNYLRCKYTEIYKLRESISSDN